VRLKIFLIFRDFFAKFGNKIVFYTSNTVDNFKTTKGEKLKKLIPALMLLAFILTSCDTDTEIIVNADTASTVRLTANETEALSVQDEEDLTETVIAEETTLTPESEADEKSDETADPESESKTESERVSEAESESITDLPQDTVFTETETVTEPPESDTAVPETEVPIPEEEPPVILTERPNKYYDRGTIYLTFDDGPGRYTEEVLRILDEYGVKATFFVVGNSVTKYPEQLRMIAEAGHSIGAHSMTHNYSLIYSSPEALIDDLESWEFAVVDVLGYVPAERLYRFPGGTTCTVVKDADFSALRDTLLDHDYRSFDWTFANNDKYLKNMREDQTMVAFLKESSVATLAITGKCRIMLLHETTPETVEMLPWLIEYLLGEGYKLEPLTYENVGYTFVN